MMAGSTGAPLTVGPFVGARFAGGVYLLAEDVNGGKSCLRTPLYLSWSLANGETHISSAGGTYRSSSSNPFSGPPTLSVIRSSAT